MSNGSKIAIVVGTALLIFFFAVALPCISTINQENELRQAILASQKSNHVVYDRVWKTLQQQAGVTDRYATQFKDIYAEIMSSRSREGEAKLAKFVTESNPQFDSSLFSKLMASIESNRLDFERAQKELIDRKRTHDTLLGTIPSGWVLSILGRKPIDIQLVTSTKTTESFDSGKDDDVHLFEKSSR